MKLPLKILYVLKIYRVFNLKKCSMVLKVLLCEAQLIKISLREAKIKDGSNCFTKNTKHDETFRILNTLLTHRICNRRINTIDY